MKRVLRDGERGSGFLADKVVVFGCGYVQKHTSEEKVYGEIFFSFLKELRSIISLRLKNR